MRFRIVNVYVFAILITAFFGCASKMPEVENVPRINSSALDTFFSQYGENLAFLSCLRCECFISEYNRSFKLTGKAPEAYVLFSDTRCNRLLFPVIHINSAHVEAISEDFYNLTLIKRRKSHITTKIVSAEESNKLNSITASFFK